MSDRDTPTSSESERVGPSFYDEHYFDSQPHLVDAGSRFQRYRTEKVLQLLAPQSEDRVVDMGCGWGTITFSLAPAVQEVLGIDFSRQAIDRCRARLEEDRVRNVELRLGEAESTGLGEATVDAVVAADLFEHLYPDDSEAVAAEAFRVLKPGGRFAIWTPCPTHIIEVLKQRNLLLERAESHVDYKTLKQMTGILERAGFRIVRAEFAESHLPGLSLVERLVQRWIPLLRRRVAVLAVKPSTRTLVG